MLFGWPKVEAGRGSGQREAKRKRKRQKSAARKNAAQPKSSRRLDSSMPGIAPPRPAARPPALEFGYLW